MAKASMLQRRNLQAEAAFIPDTDGRLKVAFIPGCLYYKKAYEKLNNSKPWLAVVRKTQIDGAEIKKRENYRI